ncbi:MAG: hypothetical protein ACLSGB_02100 [Dorea sp.]
MQKSWVSISLKEPYDANDNTTGQEHAEYLAVVINDQYYYDEEGVS